jgi:hypothetical protein
MIAAVSQIIETDMNVRFELSQDSAVSAFNLGISAEVVIEVLQRLSHNRIDENLVFALHDWEKRYKEISLHQGLVLCLSPERHYLADTKPLSGYIKEILAPGVYLLSENTEERIINALKKAGITIFADKTKNQTQDYVQENIEAYGIRNFYPNINGIPGVSFFEEKTETDGASVNGVSASVLIENFHSILNKMDPGAEQFDELTARINRRMVLCESQLKHAHVRYEKLEARGLDYAGKVLITKQAIALQSPLEIFWQGRQKHIFGIPKAIEKSEGENVLVIDPVNDKDNALRIPLGKISLLRRIKKSIFENNYYQE